MQTMYIKIMTTKHNLLTDSCSAKWQCFSCAVSKFTYLLTNTVTSLARTHITHTLGLRRWIFWPCWKSLVLYRDAKG